MGKSPGKWLKTILFGKKSSRSHSAEKQSKKDSKTEAPKKVLKDKQRSLGKEIPQNQDVSAAVVSEPLPLNIEKGQNTHVQQQNKQKLPDGTEKLAVSTSIDKAVVIEAAEKPTELCVSEAVDTIHHLDRSKEESAAIKAQAAFRGYLARRAFRALRGLIKLQALVRGHLVRRQAVGSLRCLQAIVRFQALVRAHQVRLSEQGLAIQKTLKQRRRQICLRGNELERSSSISLVVNRTSQSEKLLANAFARQLLESTPKPNSLHIGFGSDKPDSGWNWLERWMSARPWDLSVQASNSSNAKCQKRNENVQLTEAETERPKRSMRKVSNSTLDAVSNQLDIEAEKPKRSLRKIASLAVDSVSDQPDVETEKPKRSSRKVLNSTLDSVSDQADFEAEKHKRSLRKISNSTVDSVLDQPEVEAEKMKRNLRRLSKSTLESVSDQPSMQSTMVSSMNINDEAIQHVNSDQFSFDQLSKRHETVPAVHEISAVQLSVSPPESTTRDDASSHQRMASSVVNGDLTSAKHDRVELTTKNEPPLSATDQKIGRRRSSFGSVKGDYAENGSQGSPSVPSYMAATESAKAKVRGQGSPRLSPDVPEKSTIRRFSLPTASNGKHISLSPRVQTTKGNSRSDRSLLSSKDATEKVIQAEWRR